MKDEIATPDRPRVPRAALALALVQGLLLWWFLAGMPEDRWPADDPRVMSPIVLLLAVLPLSLQLLWPFKHERVLQAALAGGAVFVAVTAALYAAAHTPPGYTAAHVPPDYVDSGVIAGFVLPLLLAWLLAMPLLKLRLTEGRWTGPYPALFDLTWRGALTLAEAALFTGVFWLLLAIASAAFSALGIEIGHVLWTPFIVLTASAVVGTLAIHLIGAAAGTIDGLLRPLLNLLKWLAPLAGLIVTAFTLALLPRLPMLLAQGQRVIEATWLLWLVAVTVLLLNAAYQSGRDPPGYGRRIDRALRIVPPLLIIIAAVALYSLAARTAAFGLTPTRYWGFVAAAAALAYAIGYSMAAWSPGAWFARMGQVNVLIALASLTVLLLSLTPLVDPLRLSIDSQARRAIDAGDDSARDGALDFLGREAGASGRRRLDGIARLPDAAGGSAALRSAAARARPPTTADRQTPEDLLARIERPPGAPPIEPGLESALRTARTTDETLARMTGMLLLRVDADGDGAVDALLIDDDGFHRYWLFSAGAEGLWTQRSSGSMVWRGPQDAAMRAALRRGEVRTLPPPMQDLQVDGRRVMLLPSE